MKALGLILILLIFLSSGCVQESLNIGGTGIDEINSNPDLYIGKEVKVKGKMVFSMGNEIKRWFPVLEDSNGYRTNLDVGGKFNFETWDMGGRVLYPGTTYTAKGTYSFYEICKCQRFNRVSSNWGYIRTLTQDMFLVEECLKQDKVGSGDAPVRCEPETTEKLYYLDVTEIN